MEQPRSILIIQTAFIGDVILATALIESLHLKFPQCQLDFAVRKGNEGLLENHPVLRETLVFDKSNKYINLIRLIRKVRARRYDYVINVQRFATTGLLTALSAARHTIGFSKNPLSFLFSVKVPHEVTGKHEVERNQLLINSLVGNVNSKPRLYPTVEQFEKVKIYKDSPYITLSPASVWFTKQFPADKWIEFLLVVPAGLKVYLLGARNDRDFCAMIQENSSNKTIVNLAGELSLLESAALMKGARMNYVNDSAPMHLASALNAPVAAIYCSTVPSFGFGPLSDTRYVVETSENLDCRPCGLHGHRKCPQGHFRCALSIGREKLLAALQ